MLGSVSSCGMTYWRIVLERPRLCSLLCHSIFPRDSTLLLEEHLKLIKGDTPPDAMLAAPVIHWHFWSSRPLIEQLGRKPVKMRFGVRLP